MMFLLTGPVIHELVVTISDSWGSGMLQRMGWRISQGFLGLLRRPGMKSRCNTEIYRPISKVGLCIRFCNDLCIVLILVLHQHDRFGLGYDKYKCAKEFRVLRNQMEMQTDLVEKKRKRGIAFGTG